MRILRHLCTITGLVLAIAVQAASPPATELYGCNFQDGKDMEDLQKVIDFYSENRAKIGSSELMKMGSNVWTQYRGSSPYDIVWANAGLTLEELGKANLAYDSSKEGQTAEARFNEVIDCGASGIVVNEVLFQDGELGLQQGGEVLVESYACQLYPGKTLEDSDAAIAVWKGPFSRAVDGPALVLRRTPIMMGEIDLMYLGVWQNIAQFTAVASSFAQDPEAATSNRLFSDAHRCQSGLWKVRNVIAGEP
jgi:hypothetical protein